MRAIVHWLIGLGIADGRGSVIKAPGVPKAVANERTNNRTE